MPTILLCTRAVGREVRAYAEAARRAGATLRVVTDRPGSLEAAWAGDAVRADFEPAPQHVEHVLRALADAPVDGVIASGDAPAWLAAHVAQARRLPWHSPDAVALATDRLRTRGRFLAVDLPVPWFVSVPARGDEDLDRLTRVRFPCTVSPASRSAGLPPILAESLTELLAARARLADALTGATDDTLMVEGVAPGDSFVLDGVLEQGALRVFALCERPVLRTDAGHACQACITPARMAPARQQVVAGHIARAALALGLHHGPIHAECRVDGDAIVVLDVLPRSMDWAIARVVPAVAPDRTRCGLEDVLVGQALGQALDHYGHQAIASGVLEVGSGGHGRVVAIEGMADVQAMAWVTAVETPAGAGDEVEAGAGVAPVLVFAQGAQPDDVIATLGEAARRVRLVVEPLAPTTRG